MEGEQNSHRQEDRENEILIVEHLRIPTPKRSSVAVCRIPEGRTRPSRRRREPFPAGFGEPDPLRRRPTDDTYKSCAPPTSHPAERRNFATPRGHIPNTWGSTGTLPGEWATRDSDIPGQGRRGRAPTGSSRLRPNSNGVGAGPVSIQSQQRRTQVRDEHRERPSQGRRPANHHVVAARRGIRRQYQPGGLAQTAANPVAGDRVADSATRCYSEPNPGGSLVHAVPIVWLQYLQDQPRRYPRSPVASDTHELGPTLQAWNGGGHKRFRPKGACAPACAE